MEAGGIIYIGHPSRTDWIKIWNSADWHYGNKACALSHLKKDISEIADDPYSFTFLGGDHAEFINLKDPRFDPLSVPKDLTVRDYGNLGHVLMTRVRDLAWPMKNKIMGALQGNHEENYMRRQEQEGLMQWLTTELGCKYLGYSCLIDICFVRNPKAFPTPTLFKPGKNDTRLNGNARKMRFYLHHGAGNATTEGGKLNAMLRFVDRFEADCYMLAHVHDQIGKPIIKIGANSTCTKLVQKEVKGLITGSYMKTYEQGCTNYGEKKGYKPVPLGARFVKIKPDTGEMRVEI